MYYKTYGNTGIKVSAIGFGGMRFNDEDVKAERFENVHGKFKTLFYFFFHLFGRAENVCIVLRKTAHPEKPVQRTGAFIAVNRAQFA